MAGGTTLKVALFVEGGPSPPPPRATQSALESIWNEVLPGALGLRAFSMVVPISKKHLVAMDPSNPPMSGAGEGLDQLMGRTLKRSPFDAAVIAWDLVPAWNPEETYCRWQETLDLYRYLSERDGLPSEWSAQAKRRLSELNGRAKPSARLRPPQLQRHSVLALCMDPMFETLLIQDEKAAKRAFGLSGNIPGWPQAGWGDLRGRHPDLDVLAPAVQAAQSMKPRRIAGVRGSLRTNKDGWGAFLLRQFLADADVGPRVLSHPLAKRLREVGPR